MSIAQQSYLLFIRMSVPGERFPNHPDALWSKEENKKNKQNKERPSFSVWPTTKETILAA